MKTIWKTQLYPTNNLPVGIPPDAKVVSVGPDPQSLPHPASSVAIWFEIDPDTLSFEDQRPDQELYLTGTGYPIWGEADEFVGTAVMPPFAWHVWKRT